jgi:hypothetical protein
VHILCATAIIEASHLGNLPLKASEIAKIIANDALGVAGSFGNGQREIKELQRLGIGSSVRAVRTEMMSN